MTKRHLVPAVDWAGAILVAGLLAAAPAQAQAQAPAQRNGNEANGRNYQPTPAQVNGPQAATGVAPSPAQQAREAGTVDDVYKQLLGHPRPGDPTVATH